MSDDLYLYIDIEGRVGKSDKPPTELDVTMISDGQLTVIRIEQDQFGNVFPEFVDPDGGYDVPVAGRENDGNGDLYTAIPIG